MLVGRRFVPEQRWVFFGLAGLTLLMFSIDSTIVAVALPTFISDLQTNLVWAGWTLTAYALTQTVMMPLVGKLAEQFGQMRVFLICVFVFTLGSLLCGLAPNVYVLIACRILQALGGGGFLPSCTGIVAEQFPRPAVGWSGCSPRSSRSAASSARTSAAPSSSTLAGARSS